MESGGESALFDRRFWRCYRLLFFIAYRILGDSQDAKKAVENCWYSASFRASQVEYEGAFRSWLARVLIDEALLLLRQRQPLRTPYLGIEPPGEQPANAKTNEMDLDDKRENRTLLPKLKDKVPKVIRDVR
jgi:DNA-directed RNA polymerase specialized sigma24 family protein